MNTSFPLLESLNDIYLNLSYLYSEYLHYDEISRLEQESYEQAKDKFDPDCGMSFREVFYRTFRKKLDNAKASAHLPPRIKSEDELEKIKQEIEYWRVDYEKNPQKYIDEEDPETDYSPVASVLELGSFRTIIRDNNIKLSKREEQYLALLENCRGIPLDELAARELCISREAICRKGGIRDRLRMKLVDHWEELLNDISWK